MTATVKRGAGRPAATARTNRHAQRTALPPRAGVVAAAREPVADPTETDPAASKARAFRDAVARSGWVSEIYLEGQLCEVTATREKETLHLAWIAGVHHNDSSTYTIGDRTIKTRNTSMARQIAARDPSVAEAEFARVGRNGVPFRKRPAEPERSRLGFDPGLMTDAELLERLRGNRVSWQNRFTQIPEQGVIPPSGDKISVTEAPDGERVVKFCDPASGFRAFRVSALLSVGRSPKRRIKNPPLCDIGPDPR